ncbi:hypothetical protein CF319_g4509 [Tilletia indica]|nr:hypothetical protein CF319_g4509 [Tilletia indica]
MSSPPLYTWSKNAHLPAHSSARIFSLQTSHPRHQHDHPPLLPQPISPLLARLRIRARVLQVEVPSAPTTTPELANISIVLRAPHNERSARHTSHGIPSPSTRPPDSQRLHWLLALSLASHDPFTAMLEVDELAPILSDIFDNPRDILTADEHDSLMAYCQPPPSGSGPSASSSTSPLVLFSNLLTAVRASREAASSR